MADLIFHFHLQSDKKLFLIHSLMSKSIPINFCPTSSNG